MNMKYRNMFHKYMSPEGGDEGSGGAGEGSGGADESTTDNKGTGEGEGEQSTSEKEAELLKEVMKKKGKITELTEQLSKFEGVDLEKYQTLIQGETDAKKAQEEAEKEKLLSEGKIKEVLELKDQEHQGKVDQVIQQHKAETEAVTAEKTQLEQQLTEANALIEELTVGNSFGNSSLIHNELISAFTPDRMRVLFGGHFEAEAGKVVAYDKPRGSEGRVPLVDKDNNPVSFDEALKRLIEGGGDSEAMYLSKARTGSGSFSTNQKANAKSEVKSGIGRIEAALNKPS